MDRGHAGRERDPGLGAVELGDRVAQRDDRRVVDPAVRVARAARRVRTAAELLGVGRRERRRLVDRDGGRAPGRRRGWRATPHGSRAWKGRAGVARRSAADATPGRRTSPPRRGRAGRPSPRPRRSPRHDRHAGDPVAARALRAVHRRVGASSSSPHRLAVLRVGDDADRHRGRDGCRRPRARPPRRPGGSSRRGPSRRSDRSRGAGRRTRRRRTGPPCRSAGRPPGRRRPRAAARGRRGGGRARSLIHLRSSRSIISRQKRGRCAGCRSTSRSSAANRYGRVRRPVSGSSVACRLASSRARRCSRPIAMPT